MKHRIILMIGAGLMMAGCCSNSNEKPTLERGWIGGEYKKAQRAMTPAGQHGRIYVKQIYPGTPAEEAGLKPGDLILAVNGRRVSRPSDFRKMVDAAAPGSRGSLQVWREGESLEIPVTIGRERYKQWHAISLGLHLSTHFDLWPNPDFALAPLARYRRPEERVELHSPEVLLKRRAGREPSQRESGVRSDEGWDAWFLIFGLNAHKRILSQESVQTETRAALRAF